jgi:3-mercaptopyruvate sulfurtransferase SseA
LGKGVIERDVEAAIPNKDQEIILYCGVGVLGSEEAEGSVNVKAAKL